MLKALLRRSRQLLSQAVRENERNKEIIDMAKAVALLPADAIPTGFDYLERYANGDAEIQPFLNYLRDQWIPRKN